MSRFHKQEVSKCICQVRCSNRCLNSRSQMECSKKICNIGRHCGNRRSVTQGLNFNKYETFVTNNCNIGVRAKEDINEHELVGEYVGEVITWDQMKQRNEAYKKEHYGRNIFYTFNYNNLVIDATKKGNISRFINHSCEPNCVAQK